MEIMKANIRDFSHYIFHCENPDNDIYIKFKFINSGTALKLDGK